MYLDFRSVNSNAVHYKKLVLSDAVMRNFWLNKYITILYWYSGQVFQTYLTILLQMPCVMHAQPIFHFMIWEILRWIPIYVYSKT
jgi:hypothetical protein